MTNLIQKLEAAQAHQPATGEWSIEDIGAHVGSPSRFWSEKCIEHFLLERARRAPLDKCLRECVAALELYRGVPMYSKTGENEPPSNEALAQLEKVLEGQVSTSQNLTKRETK